MRADRHPHRVLIVAPIGRDASLICTQLGSAGIDCDTCPDIDNLLQCLDEGAGTLMLTEEALTPETTPKLARALDRQPAWSDVPLIILTAALSLDTKPRTFRELGRRTNVTFVDRPVRVNSLVSAAQSALRARARQYQIRDLMNALEERVHERDRFLAILGHELRNPLGAILLASQMKNDDGQLDGEHATLIERQSRQLTRIVNDLLDLSRVVSGKIILKQQSMDLGDVVRQSVEAISEMAARQHVAVELKPSPVPLPVYVDPVRADQIVTNVLTNAIKYAPDGHVFVSLERDGNTALVRVSDDGVGIAENRIGTIFELFAQAENAIGRAQGGMGIGLALVRSLLQLHGGSIAAKSDGVGKGSEFVVRFPIAEGVVETPPPPEERRVEAARGAQPRRIVVVEDNTDVRELLRLKLKRLGHEVDAVGDGEAGIDTIVGRKPDLALVDIGLPGLDGYEVATRVRETIGNDVVLVAVSGFGQPEDKRRAFEAGFDEHITKPADVTDIENLLSRLPARREEL